MRCVLCGVWCVVWGVRCEVGCEAWDGMWCGVWSLSQPCGECGGMRWRQVGSRGWGGVRCGATPRGGKRWGGERCLPKTAPNTLPPNMRSCKPAAGRAKHLQEMRTTRKMQCGRNAEPMLIARASWTHKQWRCGW